MSDVENLRRELAHVKLLTVDPSSDPPTVGIIIGLSEDPTDPTVLTRVRRLPRTQAIINYLNSSEVQAKLLAPRERGIILVDVVGYSRYDALGQAAILALLQQAIDDARFAQGLFAGAATVIEQIVTTGDGCYFVFHEHLNEKFARAALAIMAGFYWAQMRHRKEFDLPVGTQHTVQVTIACHLGVVDFFQDAAGNRNCFGPGMNETARILDLGKQAAGREQPERAVANTVFFGGELQPQMTTIRDYLNSVETTRGVEIYDLGSQTDKHGVPHPIYWLTNPPTQLAIAFDSLHGEFQPVYFRV